VGCRDRDGRCWPRLLACSPLGFLCSLYDRGVQSPPAPPGTRQGTLHHTTTFGLGIGSVLRIATVVRVGALGLCMREATLDIHNKAGHQQKRGINITPHVDRILALNKDRADDYHCRMEARRTWARIIVLACCLRANDRKS
jgi:hypothetical protein